MNYFQKQKISIGIITNLIILPPSMLLINFFRKSRKQITKSTKLKQAIKKIKGRLYKEFL